MNDETNEDVHSLNDSQNMEFSPESPDIQSKASSAFFDYKHSPQGSIKQTISRSQRVSVSSYESLGFAKEALIVDPSKRSDYHLDAIYYYIAEMNILPTFEHQTKSNLCKIAKLQVVKSGELIIDKDVEFDKFCLIISGTVTFVNNGETSTLSPGETFGPDVLEDRFQKSRSTGLYRVVEGICELLTFNLDEFEKCQKAAEKFGQEDDVGMVEALYDDHLLVAVTPEKVIELLFDEKYLESEPNFIVDFFLTYKIYLSDIDSLRKKIHQHLSCSELRQKAAAILIAWLTYCPEDFKSPCMVDFVTYIILELKSKLSFGLAELITQICYARSVAYEISFNLSAEEEFPIKLEHRLIPEYSSRNRVEIFVANFDRESAVARAGLKIYDEIVFLNDFLVCDLSVPDIKNILKTEYSFNLIVKRCPIKYEYVKNSLTDLFQVTQRNQSNMLPNLNFGDYPKRSNQPRKSFAAKTLSGAKKLAFNKMKRFTLMQEHVDINSVSTETLTMPKGSGSDKNLRARSNSRSSRISSSDMEPPLSPIPQNEPPSNMHYIIRIFNTSNDPKYINVSRSDTCRKIADDLLLSESSFRKYATIRSRNRSPLDGNFQGFLFIVKMSQGGLSRISRLPDDLCGLPQLCGLNERLYYAQSSTDIKLTEEIEAQLKQGHHVSLSSLDALMVAKVITIHDFYHFTRISSKEYVAHIINNPNNISSENLDYFEKRCDLELMWVVTEILNEPNLKNRVKLINKFLNVAKYCLELGNFNTFFSIMCGLEHDLVVRLKTTWDSVPQKSIRVLNELRGLCDPVNNMSHYRTWLIKFSIAQNRGNNRFIIPLIPLLKKDLLFVHDSSKTFSSKNKSQVNYRKIRLFSKELRKISYFRDIKYSIKKSLDIKSNNNLTIVNEPSLSFGLCQSEDKSIILSDVSNNILCFVNIEKILKPGENLSSALQLNSPERRLYEEFEMIHRSKVYLECIDKLQYNIDELKLCSYRLDPPPKFILESYFKSLNLNELIGHNASSSTPGQDSSSTTTGTKESSVSADQPDEPLGALI